MSTPELMDLSTPPEADGVRRAAPVVVLALEDRVQEELIAAVATAHGVPVRRIAPEVSLENLRTGNGGSGDDLWIVGLARLHAQSLPPVDLIARIRAIDPGAHVLLSDHDRLHVDAQEQRWATREGCLGILPSLDARRYETTLRAHLPAVFESLGIAWRNDAAAAAVRAGASGPRAAGCETAHRRLAALESRGLSVDAVAAWACGGAGFEIRDRQWRGRLYPRVFTGRAAVDRLRDWLACTRSEAVEVGELLRRARLIAHVANAHRFRDAALFYRFTPNAERVAALSLAQVLAAANSRGGFDRRDRLYRGRRYPDCFIGRAAVRWFGERYGLTPAEALQLGQRMMDLGMIRHVLDAHEFRDAHLFYEFTGFARGGAARFPGQR